MRRPSLATTSLLVLAGLLFWAGHCSGDPQASAGHVPLDVRGGEPAWSDHTLNGMATRTKLPSGLTMAALPSKSTSPSLVVVLLPGTTLSDWLGAGAPNLQALMNTGAIAVMNTRTARMPSDITREPPAAAVLTLSAGARAASVADATAFSPASAPTSFGPTAGELYARRMGTAVPAGDAWVDPDWPRVLKANQGIGYQSRLGNLTDALNAKGMLLMAVAAQGSRDAGWATLFAANHDGIANVTDQRPSAQELASGGCWVVDLGGSVASADAEIGNLASAISEAHGRLLVVSPFVNDSAYAEEDRLAPVLFWGNGISAGLLRSDSTRRNGLITNVDIAPTVATYFGAALPALPFGRPPTVEPVVRPFTELRDLQSSAHAQRIGQRGLPACAIMLGICLLAFCISSIRTRDPNQFSALPSVFILALALADSARSFLIVLAVVLLAAGILTRLRPVQTVVAWFATYLAALLLVDALRGGPLMQRSLLGYSAIEGARYYGMGNEGMGALAGALIVAVSYFWPRIHLPPITSETGGAEGWSAWRSGVLTAIMVASVIIVGWPSSGAKAGGVIVLAGACVIYLASVRGQRLGWSQWLGAGALGIVLLIVIALFDAGRSTGAQSHLGGAIERIVQAGPAQALDIVVRKLAVDLKLAVHSAWAMPVWCGFLCLACQRRAVASEQAVDRALLDAGLAAAVLCLLFNDAGAVACALCLAIVCGYKSACKTGRDLAQS